MGEFRTANPRMSDDDFAKVWSQVEDKVDSEPPPKIALIGECGVGKSSTINALFNAGVEVSHTEACTKLEESVEVYVETVDGRAGALVVYDMPGLGESQATQQQHIETYQRVLADVDVALWILDGQYRAIREVQEHLGTTIARINPKLVERMVFGLNKVDAVAPGETAWHPLANLPSEDQEQNIIGRVADVRAKIADAAPKWNGAVIPYSARRRYNLPQLFAAMLDAVPTKRRWVLASRKALGDFLEFVDPSLLAGTAHERRPLNRDGASQASEKERVAQALQTLSDDEYRRISGDPSALAAWMDSIRGSSGP